MDGLHLMLMWWALFMPLDRVWALQRKEGRAWHFSWLTTVDVERTQARRRPDQAEHGDRELLEDSASVGSLALALNLQVMYTVSAILKNHTRWWGEGTAAWYALSFDWFATPLARFVLQVVPDSFLRFGTVYTYWLELVGGYLLVCPIYPQTVRPIGALLFVLFHFLNSLLLRLNLFPLLGMTSMLVFIPPWAWSWMAAQTRSLCPLTLALNPRSYSLSPKKTSISTPGIPEEDTQSVLEEEMEWKNRAGTVQRMGSFLWSLVGLFSLYICLWNLGCTGSRHGVRYIDQSFLAVKLRWDQHWSMFSPFPAINDGWQIVLGSMDPLPRSTDAFEQTERTVGENATVLLDLWEFVQVDPLAWPNQLDPNGPARWQIIQDRESYCKHKPEISSSLKNARWQKYLWRVWIEDDLSYERPQLGRHICRKWRELQQRFGPARYPKLHNFSVWWMDEPSLHPSEVKEGERAPQATGPYPGWTFDCDTGIYQDTRNLPSLMGISMQHKKASPTIVFIAAICYNQLFCRPLICPHDRQVATRDNYGFTVNPLSYRPMITDFKRNIMQFKRRVLPLQIEVEPSQSGLRKGSSFFAAWISDRVARGACDVAYILRTTWRSKPKEHGILHKVYHILRNHASHQLSRYTGGTLDFFYHLGVLP
eukprot:g35323.t1